MKLFQFHLPENTDAPSLFAPLSDMAYSLFLDSADQSHRDARYSFIMAIPVEMIESKEGRVTISNQDGQKIKNSCPFKVIKDRLEYYGFERTYQTAEDGFWGGAAGYWGYDLVRGLEIIHGRDKDFQNAPDMAIGIYDQFCRFDHKKSTAEYYVYEHDFDRAGTKFQHFLNVCSKGTMPALHIQSALDWSSTHSREEYETSVQKVIDYICAGDIFQANISQRFKARLPQNFDAYAHYCHMRRVNAAPFAAYMNLGDIKIASASPERFLAVDDFEVETRPIKGTVKRDANPDIDLQNRRNLCESDKERAENIMIVDLLRNDLSRTCEDHSVTVPQLCALESFAKVHHLVSTVTGRLRADKTPIDLLKNAFPGGSITGAPKVRAMEIIDEIEPDMRGVYCGAIGYAGFDGTMDTNISIRTLVYENDTVHFNVGGGITAASEPAREYEETIAKAAAIFESFKATNVTTEDTEPKRVHGESGGA